MENNTAQIERQREGAHASIFWVYFTILLSDLIIILILAAKSYWSKSSPIDTIIRANISYSNYSLFDY